MEIFRGHDVPHEFADSKSFVGSAHTKKLAQSEEGAPVIVYHVKFDSGARTNWHAHSGAQWLLILEGQIRVQTWGQPPHDVVAGDAVVIAPGEKHWHGALPAARGVHLAVNINVTTKWMEPVTDQQYYGQSPSI
jgi:quercetin dioxygenase-like cupin family protein